MAGRCPVHETARRLPVPQPHDVGAEKPRLCRQRGRSRRSDHRDPVYGQPGVAGVHTRGNRLRVHGRQPNRSGQPPARRNPATAARPVRHRTRRYVVAVARARLARRRARPSAARGLLPGAAPVRRQRLTRAPRAPDSPASADRGRARQLRGGLRLTEESPRARARVRATARAADRLLARYDGTTATVAARYQSARTAARPAG